MKTNSVEDLMILPELTEVRVVEIWGFHDGVISGLLHYQNQVCEFHWLDDHERDYHDERHYTVHDQSGAIIGRLLETVVNSFRKTKTKKLPSGRVVQALTTVLKGDDEV